MVSYAVSIASVKSVVELEVTFVGIVKSINFCAVLLKGVG